MSASMSSAGAAQRQRGIGKAILAGGLIAGTVDIFAASLITHYSPMMITRFVAGGVLGKTALEGGALITLLGLLLQWAMGLLIAAIFVVAAMRMKWMLRLTIVAGLLYGVVVYFVMNYVVLPLSAWHQVPAFKLISFAENMLAMLVFGLIVSFCAKRWL